MADNADKGDDKAREFAAKMLDERLPFLVAHKPDVLRPIGKTYAIVIKDVGAWTLDCKVPKSAKVAVDDPTIKAAHCVIRVGPKTFKHLMDDPGGRAMQLFMQGKILVEGDLQLVARLTPLLAVLKVQK